MRISISRKQHQFITPSDQPDGEEATLEFEPLSLAEEAELLESLMKTGGLETTLVNRLFRKLLVGWEGVLDEDDNPLEFDEKWKRKTPEFVVMAFEPKYRFDCVSQLMSRAEAGDEETRGKSD